jgi:hypothetical protein
MFIYRVLPALDQNVLVWFLKLQHGFLYKLTPAIAASAFWNLFVPYFVALAPEYFPSF